MIVLTKQQHAIFQAVADGKNSKEIAEALNITQNAVWKSKEKVVETYDFKNSYNAVAELIRKGVID